MILEKYKNATIFFNEGPLSDDPLFGKELFQFSIVRHPIPRFLSHFLHAVTLPPTLFNDTLKVSIPGVAACTTRQLGTCFCTYTGVIVYCQTLPLIGFLSLLYAATSALEHHIP